jgi:uncharacterized membrane protein YfcA
MEYVVIWITAALASALALPSGFGLGTILMPAFALFFPLDLAVAMTAVVHLLNNVFKFILYGKSADTGVLLRFGVPAIIAAFVGARALLLLSGLHPLATYSIGGWVLHVQPVKAVVALLIAVFALLDFLPSLENVSFDRSLLPLGGVLSGFFGGLTGHQGALRSAFLVRSGLTKESFIATGVVLSCLVDFSRISVYSAYFSSEGFTESALLVGGAVIFACIGALAAHRTVKEASLPTIRLLVAIMLLAIAFALGMGLI